MFGREKPSVQYPDTERFVPMKGDLSEFARDDGQTFETTLQTNHEDTRAIDPTDLSVNFKKVNPLPDSVEKETRRNHKVGIGVGLGLAGLTAAVVAGLGLNKADSTDQVTTPKQTHPATSTQTTPGESTPPTTPETGGQLNEFQKAGELGQVGVLPTEAQFNQALIPVTSEQATTKTAALAAIQLSADLHIVFIGGETDWKQGYYQRESKESIARREKILDNIFDPTAIIYENAIQAQVIAIANERDFLQDPNNRVSPRIEPYFTETYKVVNVINNSDGTFTVEMGRTVISNYEDLDGTFHKIVRSSTYFEQDIVKYDASTKQWRAIQLNPLGSEQTINKP